MATTGLVAQAYGADDTQQQFKLLVQAASLALMFGIAAIALQSPILNLAMALSDASVEVERYCREYFQVRIWSTPFALMNLVMLGWLLGRQQPKAAMWQLIVANLVNIILDVLFVLVLGWGVKGAALASVFADISGFLVALTMVRGQLSKLGGFKLFTVAKQLSLQSYGKLMSLNTDIFIRSLCLQLSFAFMTFYGAGLGDNTVAANAVLLNLLMLISYALDGIAYYAEAEVGRAYGQKNSRLMQESVTLAWAWSAIAALGFTLFFALAGSNIISMLTSLTEVQAVAEQYLLWVVFLPLLAFGSYLFDGVYIGAAKGSIMRNSMILSTFGVFFPVWYLLQAQGNHALWAAMSCFMLARSASLSLHYWFRLKQALN